MPNDHYIQDPSKIERANEYVAGVRRRADLGFINKAQKKDTIDSLNRAWDTLVIEAIHYILWSARTDTNDCWVWDRKDFQKINETTNVPAAHVWRQKYADFYGAYPEFRGAVEIANDLAGLRAAIVAAPFIEKPKSKTRLEEDLRLVSAKTCQICDRPILAERGKIAHHGYMRPAGWGAQTASCYGALKLPYEESRDNLAKYIKIMEEKLARMEAGLIAVENEEAALRVDYQGKNWIRSHREEKYFYCKRGTFSTSLEAAKAEALYPHHLASLSFDKVKAETIREIKTNIKDLERYIVGQQVRWDGWETLKKRKHLPRLV